MRLEGARVLLTGASGGIGGEIARALRGRGASLVLSGRRADALARLASELEAEVVCADLALRADVEQLARAARDVDVLIANAALPASGRLLDLGQEQIDIMLEVDLHAPIALARALAPGMASRRHGHIVFISSLSGKASAPASSIYSAAKFGLRGFAHGARADLRPAGVGVSVIMPGFIRDAGMFAQTAVKLPPGVGTSSPQEVAAAVITAVERNRAEITVAPLGMRVGAGIASVAPGAAAALQRLLGGAQVAQRVSDGQRDLRPGGDREP